MTRFARTFALLLLALALSPSLLFAQQIQRTEDGLETTGGSIRIRTTGN